MDECVFCGIVAGDRPAHLVHGTPSVVAFMDQFRQPSDVAHVLVIPRAHVENIYGIDDALGAELFSVHALIARAVKRAFATDGITTWSSNEPGANLHVDVTPRGPRRQLRAVIGDEHEFRHADRDLPGRLHPQRNGRLGHHPGGVRY